MSKKTISSLELTALVNELQFLINGKFSQIYHQEKKELIFQLHARGQGKQLLKIIPGKFLCLTEEKHAPLKPSSFCMQLRKYINNSVIKGIFQQGADRIIIFELEKQEKFTLIVELFSKGNIILLNSENKIITSLERQIWKDRTIKPGLKYVFPEPGFNWKKINFASLKTILNKSNKKNLATSLATEIGLGGLYAEELCKLSKIDKNMSPKETIDSEIKKLVSTFKQILKQIEKPQGYIYTEQITPFKLITSEPIEIKKTYNASINTINPFLKISPYQQKIISFGKVISRQKEAIKKQERGIILNTEKGEKIYTNYLKLDGLLKIVAELRKNKEWVEIKKELIKLKRVVSVNLKNKKVILRL